MFKLTLSNADLLKNSIPIIADIIDEGVFKVDKTGISLVSPDRTMVAVIDFKLLSSAFEEYKVESAESLGLNLANLVSVIKRIKSSDKVILQSEGKNRLEIILEGNGKRKFEIPLLDISTEKPPIDQLDFKGKIELSSNILEEGISDADVVDDSIVFEATANLFRMWAKGDVSSAQLELPKGAEGLLKMEIEERIRSRYPLEYLKKMIKAAKLADQAVIEFGTDYPMRLHFKVIDKMSMSFILAPRVEE